MSSRQRAWSTWRKEHQNRGGRVEGSTLDHLPERCELLRYDLKGSNVAYITKFEDKFQ